MFLLFIARLFVPLQSQTGRDARVVEWTALEMRRTLTGTLGSNPSLSAEYSKKREFQGPLFIFRKSPALKDRLDEPHLWCLCTYWLTYILINRLFALFLRALGFAASLLKGRKNGGVGSMMSISS